MRELIYIITGYLSGSILFSEIASRSLKCGDIKENSADKNPGAMNAFRNGGFLCGIMTLAGDVLKGFLPVWLYLAGTDREMLGMGFAFVLAAPVIGHIFPLYHRFHGGKGIAATFGCLLGLLPESLPIMILAGCFIMFSFVIKITPDYYCTIVTYLTVGVLLRLLEGYSPVSLGFFIIMGAVGIRMFGSKEKKEMCKVKFLWMR